MISREEKNKKYITQINHEKAVKTSKTILKVLGIIILLFTLTFLYLYFLGPRGLTTKEYVINDNNLPSSFNGVKALHFSDLLFGSTIKDNDINKISEEINFINPDIVFFTGNIISDDYKISEDEIKLLNDFFKNIPYTIGKYAVLGDLDTTTFDLIMENTGFNIISNEVVDVYNDKQKINIVGIKDDEIKSITVTDGYTITLINNYDKYQTYNLSSNIILSGHNLGGEIRLFNFPILGNDEHLNDYYEERSSKVYISSGLGTRHHMRLMNKPSLNVYRFYNK